MNPNINPDGENLNAAEKEFEKVLRPAEFDDFTGQQEVVEPTGGRRRPGT